MDSWDEEVKWFMLEEEEEDDELFFVLVHSGPHTSIGHVWWEGAGAHLILGIFSSV